MPRHNWMAEVLFQGSSKTRKRGCSTSSSSSSILVRKHRGPRSSTPAPSWRMTPLRVPRKSPKYAPSLGGGLRSKPVSARKLAATLWEMNEIPSPSVTVRGSVSGKKMPKKETKLREKIGSTAWSVHSGSLPPHLSDPSHSPTSEKMDRSGTGSRYRKHPPSMSHRLRPAENNLGIIDSLSSASLMEVETRSRPQTTTGSITRVRTTHLKDVSNALTTSKELLKIIHRVSSTHNKQPTTSNSLVSALHAELERARLLVNQLIHEQRSDHQNQNQNEVNYLMKCLAEEKSSRRNKEHQAVEAAIESIAYELEIERKLRRRSESLNKRLAMELTDMKAALLKAAKELENEKRTREIMEEMCEDFAWMHKTRTFPKQIEESGESNWDGGGFSSESELINENNNSKPTHFKGRKSQSTKEHQKMVSDGVEFGDMKGEVVHNSETKEMQRRRRSCGDKFGKGGTLITTRRDQVLLNASLLGCSKPSYSGLARLSQDKGRMSSGYYPIPRRSNR